MISHIKFWCVAILSLCLVSCLGVNEEDLSGNFLPPEVSVEDVILDNQTISIMLKGTYKLTSASAVVDECGFYYSGDSDFTSAAKVISEACSDEFSSSIHPKHYGTEYFYKSFISNGKAEIVSEIKSFIMPEFDYFVELKEPSVVAALGKDVKVKSSVKVASGISVSELGVVYSTEANVNIEDEKVISIKDDEISVEIKGLTTGQKYYMRSYLKSDANIVYSDEVEFIPHSVPSVTTKAITEIKYTSALSGGEDMVDNGLEITSKGIVWSTIPNPTIDVLTKTEDGKGNAEYTSAMSSLLPGTKYYVRAYAVNSDGVGYGEELSFETLSLSNASVQTISVTNVTSSSAVSGGNITDDGGSEITSRGVVWGLNSNPTIDRDKKTQNGTGIGQYSSNVTGLEPGTMYYLRAYAVNTQGVSYGKEVCFTTDCVIPTVTTDEATDISPTSAMVGGNVIASGGSDILERGIVWGTSQGPTVDDNKIQSGDGIGTFSVSLDELSLATTYFVKAYAINAVGVSYGNEISFTTGTTKASVSTKEISDISGTSAKSGGTITSDGGTAITARGVVWSTSNNPVVEYDLKTIDGADIGYYESAIDGLNPGTTYYLRAYATNINGTAYGEEHSFTTSVIPPTISTSVPKEITNSSAVVGGNVIATGGADVSECGIVWSKNNTPTTSDNKITAASGLGEFYLELSDLEKGTTYYVRAYATNSAGTSYGNVESFTTKTLSAQIDPHIDVDSYNSAMVKVLVENPDNESVEFGIVYSTSPHPDLSSKSSQSTNPGISGPCWMYDLIIGKTYYIRAYVLNTTTNECVLSDEDIIYTHSIPDLNLTTDTPQSVSFTTAVCVGNVNYETTYYISQYVQVSTTYNPIVSCGFVYATTPNPTIGVGELTNDGNQKNFTHTLTGLKSNTTYYVRTYATSKVGTFYGNQISFTTKKMEGDTEDVGSEGYEW